MSLDQMNGQRQFEFMSKFDYIREAGTKGEERAANEILKELKEFGVQGQIEEFPFDSYRINQAKLVITKPYEKEYTVTGYGFSKNTDINGIEAPFLYVENGDEISLSYAEGKIVMVNQIVRGDMLQKLTEAGAVGFVSIGGTPIDDGVDLIPPAVRLSSKTEHKLPGVHIHCLDAAEIVEKQGSWAKLLLQQEKLCATSRNVVAKIEGVEKPEEVLTLTAHYDSVPAGPGAYDNMAGAAIIMELCRYFQEHRPGRTLEFVWFGAEEKGLLGSLNYVETHKEELLGHRFNMNVDLAGQLVGGNVFGVAGEESICHILTYLAGEIGMGVSTRHAIWGSDSNSFAFHGVPAMTMNRDGFGLHTRHDTLSHISPWSLERSAKLLCHVAGSLSHTKVIPFPRSVPEKLHKELEEYFGR